jgi:hypothetical protein
LSRFSGPSREALEAVFVLKHGEPSTTGWSPRLRHRLGYFTPDDVYEATVASLVEEGCSWADLGCGRDLFPNNRRLAEQLSRRCRYLAGVDPDGTIEENRFVHERVRTRIEVYHPEVEFDLITLRMVVEHVGDPTAMAIALSRLARTGGLVVILTVNRLSPVPLLTGLVPFRLHHPIKRLLWGTEERDTFPVTYRMNTRRELGRHLRRAGFVERWFHHVDDCRTFGRFRPLHAAELALWRILRGLGLGYPENCLLGVYEKVGVPALRTSVLQGDAS